MRHLRWNGNDGFSKCVAIIFAFAAAAPTGSRAEEQETNRYPLEPARTTSPRATLESFFNGCETIYGIIKHDKGGMGRIQTQSEYTDRVLGCLDLSEQPDFVRKSAGGRSAICLKEILDRLDPESFSNIPGETEVLAAKEEGNPIESWRFPHTDVTITLIKEGDQAGEYLFSAETVERAPEFYERVESLPYQKKTTPFFYQWFLSEPGPWVRPVVDLLPDGTRTTMAGGHAIWQWAGLVFAIAFSASLMVFSYRLGQRISRMRRQRGQLIRYCLTISFSVAAMLMPWGFIWFVKNQLRLSGTTLYALEFASSLLILIGAMVVIVGVANRVAAIIIANPKIQPKGLDAQLVRIVCKVLGLVTAVIVFLEGGKYLGVPLSTLLASAGVGGLAVALAAQDSLKNLFGTMMIILDKPYRIGERIATKDYDGVVEEIGLRSTKIRLLNGHQASIPNEDLARSDIENIGRRPYIRRLTELRIPIDTPVAKAERAVEIVQEILKDHEGMKPELPPRVHFHEFDPDALLIRVCYWYHPPEYWDYLAFGERVNLEIKTQFDTEQIRFALPTTVTQLKADSDADFPEMVAKEK